MAILAGFEQFGDLGPDPKATAEWVSKLGVAQKLDMTPEQLQAAVEKFRQQHQERFGQGFDAGSDPLGIARGILSNVPGYKDIGSDPQYIEQLAQSAASSDWRGADLARQQAVESDKDKGFLGMGGIVDALAIGAGLYFGAPYIAEAFSGGAVATTAAEGGMMGLTGAVGEGTLTGITAAEAATATTVASTIKSLLPSSDTLKTIANVATTVGGVVAVKGAIDTIREGGVETTQTTETTPVAPTEYDLWMQTWNKEQAERITAQQAITDKETKRQQDNAAAHDPKNIRQYIETVLADPSMSNEDKGKLFSEVMHNYGVTVTEIEDATNYTIDQIVTFTGVDLTDAEVLSRNAVEMSNIALDAARQGTAATPEQAELISTMFFGDKFQRSPDPETFIKTHVEGIMARTDLTDDQKGAMFKSDMEKYGLTATEVSHALNRPGPRNITLPGAENLTGPQQGPLQYTPEMVSQFTGVPITPGESGVQTQEWGGAYGLGLSEIDRISDTTLRRINEETAAASGLNPQDTPMQALAGTSPHALEMGSGLFGETVRQKANLFNTMQAGESAAMLNYPLAAQTAQNSTNQAASQISLAAAQFQNELAQQGVSNRNRLFGVGQGGGAQPLNLGSRTGSGGTKSTVTTNTPLGLKDYVGLVEGLGKIVKGGLFN